MGILLCLCASLAGLVMAVGLSRRETVLPRVFLALPAAFSFVAIATTSVGTSFVIDWVPSLGVEAAFRLTGLGWLMGMLVSGIGALIVLYAAGYMGDRKKGIHLTALLYAFMFAMLGVVMSDHLILLFVFWELTSISSYLLIGFDREKSVSRRNALQALLVTGLGGLALLAGFLILADAGGSWRVSELAKIQDHPTYLAALILVLLGAFTKSAQFPFYFWLPNAMSAPTPVSAYLHSATMVKAGVFLLALLSPYLGGTPAWQWTLMISGGLTLLIGGFFGLKQQDLKALLAGTTLGVLGMITYLIGVGTKYALLSALVLLLAHALYKACLFMAAGAVDHGTGTRDLRILGGLRKAMPWTFAAVALAGFSKMGLPPFSGFLAKETMYKAGLGVSEWFVPVLLLGNVLMFVLAAKALWIPFMRPVQGELPHTPHEASWAMRIGPLLLAALGLLTGLVPSFTDRLIDPALATVTGKEDAHGHLHLWAGINAPLLLSLLTFALGGVWSWWHLKHTSAKDAARTLGDRSYDVTLNGVTGFAVWQTRILQSGFLRRYLLIILLSATFLVSTELIHWGGTLTLDFTDASMLTYATAFIMIVSTVMAIRSRSRLTSIVSLGAVGFGVAMIFAIFSAPDLAITQILVETLTVVFFAWVVHKLPQFSTYSEGKVMRRDALLASIVGLAVTLLMLTSLGNPGERELATQLSEQSLPKGYGANVVNVILVDFRALDTLGEITVLSIAAVGVAALLVMKGGSKQKEES